MQTILVLAENHTAHEPGKEIARVDVPPAALELVMTAFSIEVETGSGPIYYRIEHRNRQTMISPFCDLDGHPCGIEIWVNAVPVRDLSDSDI